MHFVVTKELVPKLADFGSSFLILGLCFNIHVAGKDLDVDQSVEHTRTTGTALYMVNFTCVNVINIKFLGKAPEVTSIKLLKLYLKCSLIDGSDYSYPCDLFSLAIVLYEIVLKKKPYYHVKDKRQIHVKVFKNERLRPSFENYVEPSNENEKIQQSKWIKIMEKCWQVDPGQRMTSTEIVQFWELGDKKTDEQEIEMLTI